MGLITLDLSEAKQAAIADRQKTIAAKRRDQDTQKTANAIAGGFSGFMAARLNRLTADWATFTRSADQGLINDLRRLRARAREEYKNDGLAKKFVRMCERNVVGPKGFTVIPSVKQRNGKDLNKTLNAQIAAAWKEWGKKENCSADGRMSFKALTKAVVRNWARDGEVFVRKIYTQDNPFGFCLQLIDPDQVPESMNRLAPGGKNQIRMGVEVNNFMRPVAYWMYSGHPNETGTHKIVRVPAEEVYHVYVSDEINASRGYTPLAPVLFDLRMLEGYASAEVIGARLISSIMGFIKNPLNMQYEGADDPADGIDENGEAKRSSGVAFTAEPGIWRELAPGQEPVSFNPQRPNGNFSDFSTKIERRAASGLDVSYHSLASDYERVSYGSARVGMVEERENWEDLQEMFTEKLVELVYGDWMQMASLKVLDLPRPWKECLDAEVHGRSWDWIDPLKDMQAAVLSVENGFNTRTAILAKQGKSFEEVMEQLATEKEKIDELGLVLGSDLKGVADSPTEDPNGTGGAGSAQPEDGTKKPKTAKTST